MSMTELIRDYTTMTTAAAAQMQRELGIANLLEAWMQRRLLQRGSLSDGSVYQFHGIGCCIEWTDDIDLDFDFGPSGRADGFDGWRMWRFAEQFPSKYSDFQQHNQVEIALRALVDEGVSESSGRSCFLLYFSPGRCRS